MSSCSGESDFYGPSELSEGEFECYNDTAEYGATSAHSAPPRPETLSQGQLEERRAHDAHLVSLVKAGVSVAHARELLAASRWDVHACLSADSDSPDGGVQRLRALALGCGLAAGGTGVCPMCQEPLPASCDEAGAYQESAVLSFTGCAAGATHAAHAECLAAYARVCIADGASGEAARPGVVHCAQCLADGAHTPGCLTEAQVASLVSPELMELYLKARALAAGARRRRPTLGTQPWRFMLRNAARVARTHASQRTR